MRSRRAGAAAALIDAIAGWRGTTAVPLVVAIDGHGAAGKSTLAGIVGYEPDVAIVHVDDFWRVPNAPVGGPPTEEHPLAEYYNWSRLRAQALRPLLAGDVAEFVAVDPNSLQLSERVIEPAAVVLVEGVSAASEPLADLIDRAVLVETPEPVRLARLRSRIRPDRWDESWLEAERSYLATRPAESFDLVIAGVHAA